METKPSYYLVASDDQMIPPPAQRAMAGRVKAEVMEVPGSHSVYVSKPAEVAEMIEKAGTSSN
jgi:pimeloyl-ACP methyl ester carboxylesterase